MHGNISVDNLAGISDLIIAKSFEGILRRNLEEISAKIFGEISGKIP